MVKKKTTEEKVKSETKKSVTKPTPKPEQVKQLASTKSEQAKQSAPAKSEQVKQPVSMKSEQVKQSTPTKSEPQKQSCSCWACCITTAVIMAVVCGVASYFMCERIHRDYANGIEQKINANGNASNAELASLKTEIANLKKDVDECKTVKQIQYDNSKLRTKWKAWSDLKNKMDTNEPIDEELKRVKEVFADDAELLRKIDDLLTETEKSAEVIPQNIRKYVDKFVSLKRIDSKKVAEISGYVLSSPCNGE